MDIDFGKPMEDKRSPEWPAVRDAHLKIEPVCQVCGGSEYLNVHHIQPFHLYPARELDPTNLITLCEGKKFVNCHLFVGHLGSFKSFNVNVRTDSDIWDNKIKDRPK